MHIRLIAVGSKMPHWVEDGFNEYAKRLVGAISLVEIPMEKRTKGAVITRLVEKEGHKILTVLKPSHFVVALDVKGKTLSTEGLATQLKSWQQEGRNVDFLIGGPDGLSDECLKRAELRLSISTFTLPHPLVRILITEQLYRAQTILQNHPYHR